MRTDILKAAPISCVSIAIRRVLPSLLPCLAATASAGQVTGTVNQVLQRASDGLTYVIVNGTASGQPSCATNSYWMIVAENSEAGKKEFAMLLLAKATGLRVVITGGNSCTRW